MSQFCSFFLASSAEHGRVSSKIARQLNSPKTVTTRHPYIKIGKTRSLNKVLWEDTSSQSSDNASAIACSAKLKLSAAAL